MNCISVIVSRRRHWMCLQLFSRHHRLLQVWKTQWGFAEDRMKMYGRGLTMSPQWAVSSCKNYSVNVALVCWATTASISKLLCVLVCSVGPNGFLEGEMKRQRERQRQKEADSLVVEVYCKGMDSARLKCHSVDMGFCLVPGHDRDNTPPTPPSSSSPAVNETVLRRGRPSIVAV